MREAAHDDLLELSLVENLHCENLNPIEKARAYCALHVEHGLTHDEIGQRMGEDRRTVSHAIQLLELSDDALVLIETGKLSAAHGKRLLAITDPRSQSEFARNAAAKRWSVRHLESQIRAQAQPRSARTVTNLSELNELQTLFSQALGIRARVKKIVRTRGRGLRVECDSEVELSQLLDWWRKALEAKR